jgi:GABA permease
MENPFRSEAAAFRFLLMTIGGFALIVLAGLVSDWLGLAVFLLLSAAAVWLYLRQRGERPPRQHVAHLSPPDEHRVLVIANETVGGEELMKEIDELALAGRTRFHVVCPALNSRLKTWTSDSDAAREAAQQRLDATLARLAEVGIESTGEVGDLDPLVSIEDAVRTFHPDEIVISTHPVGKSNWLERGVVTAARERFDLNVTHVVVDLEAQQARQSEK